MRTLWLLGAAHAVNHAQAALLPLVYVKVIEEFGIGVETIAYLAAVGGVLSGSIQLSYAALTRFVSRRMLLGIGGILFGGGMAAQAAAPGFPLFAAANVVSRVGGSPQHPVGNGLLAEQFPPERRGFAISAHIAGGNVGTIAVPLLGAFLIDTLIGWRATVILFGVPAIVIAVAIMLLVRETGTDREAARASGSIRAAFGRILRDRDIVLVYISSVLGGGGRGLGVLNIFVPLYLAFVVGLDLGLVSLMYTVLLIGSVPAPLVAGWLSDRYGRKELIVLVYLCGAAALAVFTLAGDNVPMLWLGIVLMSAFNFVESPQLQALLADLAPPQSRDASFALYFTLAFGVGSLWTAVYGAVVQGAGQTAGLPMVFWIMAASFLAAALAVLPIRADRGRGTTGTAGRLA
jgi:MFS family permease